MSSQIHLDEVEEKQKKVEENWAISEQQIHSSIKLLYSFFDTKLSNELKRKTSIKMDVIDYEQTRINQYYEQETQELASEIRVLNRRLEDEDGDNR